MTIEQSSDLRRAARSGALGLLGSVYAGIAGFALTVVVGRLLGVDGGGVFFEAVAVFTIVNGLVILGADTGLVREIARLRALGCEYLLRSLLVVSLVPVLAISAVAAVAVYVSAPVLAESIAPAHRDALTSYLHIAAVVLPVAGAGAACLQGASRSLGSIRPFVGLQQFALPTLRVCLIALVGMMALGTTATMAAWALPLVLVHVAALAYVLGRSSRLSQRTAGPAVSSHQRHGLAKDFWSVSLPRGVASFLETCIIWADIIIVGVLASTAEAGAYAAASRFITTGTLALLAMRLASAPMFSAAFARGETNRASDLHGATTVWIVLLSWPMFITLAAFSTTLLQVFGQEFTSAGLALSILSVGMLGYMALGNVNSILLMAGKSILTARNTAVALLVNLCLNIALVPTWGMEGAAVAWVVTMSLDSALCARQVRRVLGLRIDWRRLRLAIMLAVLCWGAPAMAWALLGWVGWAAAGIYLALCSTAYLGALYRNRSSLLLDDLGSLVRRQAA